MYSTRLHATGGSFKSALTGKVYEFKKTPDNSDRRRATQAMMADDQVIRQAAHARAGKALTDIEILRFKSPDTRTLREKAASDTIHRTNEPRDVDHNNYEVRANALRDQLAREARPSRREAIETRLRLAEAESERFERQLEAKRDWQEKLAHPDVKTARVLADSWHVLLRTSHDPELQSLLERCEAAIKTLDQTADHASCRAALTEIESAYEAVKTNRIKGLEQQAAEIRAQARVVKAEAEATPDQAGELAASK